MAYYKQWNSIVNKVFELIRNNDKLLRYIGNAAPNPYDEVANSWSDIYLKNVFPMPREADSVGDQKTFVNVYMGYSNPPEGNPYFSEDFLYIEVGCYLDCWPLENGEVRPYSICSMIDAMIDNKTIGDMSIKKATPLSTKVIRFGDMYYGYRMIYSLSNMGGVDCG